MRQLLTILIAVLGTSVCISCNRNGSDAHIQDSIESQDPNVVFEVKEGQSKEYYLDAWKRLEAAFQPYQSAQSVPSQEFSEEYGKALLLVSRELYKYDDIDPQIAISVVRNLTDEIGKSVEGIDELIAKTSALPPDAPKRANLLNSLDGLRYVRRLDAVSLKTNPDEYNAIAMEALEYCLNNPNSNLILNVIQPLSAQDRAALAPVREAAIEKFKASGNPKLVEQAKKLESVDRFDALVGSEFKVEGVCVDGSKLDWEDYRGKVVLVFFTKYPMDIYQDVKTNALQTLYEKYRDAGFEAIEYSLEENPARQAEYLSNPPRPWKVVSSVNTRSCPDQDYIELGEYFSIETYPTRILVGKDGKVVSNGNVYVTPGLERYLAEEYPDVQ